MTIFIGKYTSLVIPSTSKVSSSAVVLAEISNLVIWAQICLKQKLTHTKTHHLVTVEQTKLTQYSIPSQRKWQLTGWLLCIHCTLLAVQHRTVHSSHSTSEPTGGCLGCRPTDAFYSALRETWTSSSSCIAGNDASKDREA